MKWAPLNIGHYVKHCHDSLITVSPVNQYFKTSPSLSVTHQILSNITGEQRVSNLQLKLLTHLWLKHVNLMLPFHVIQSGKLERRDIDIRIPTGRIRLSPVM